MAYVSKEKKAKIAAALKKVVDKKLMGYTLAVRHHSAIVMTITRVNKEWLESIMNPEPFGIIEERGDGAINHYHLDKKFNEDGVKVFREILAALNTDNYDRSDSMTDYFDVGHYVDLRVGKWNKPVKFE